MLPPDGAKVMTNKSKSIQKIVTINHSCCEFLTDYTISINKYTYINLKLGNKPARNTRFKKKYIYIMYSIYKVKCSLTFSVNCIPQWVRLSTFQRIHYAARNIVSLQLFKVNDQNLSKSVCRLLNLHMFPEITAQTWPQCPQPCRHTKDSFLHSSALV